MGSRGLNVRNLAFHLRQYTNWPNQVKGEKWPQPSLLDAEFCWLIVDFLAETLLTRGPGVDNLLACVG
jgi:hypothetical protein